MRMRLLLAAAMTFLALGPARAQYAAPSGAMDTSSGYQHQLFEHQLERRRHDEHELYQQRLEKQEVEQSEQSHQEQKLEVERQEQKHEAAKQAFEKAEAARHH